ncbi:hypothetical protein [Oceanomicrobium pacificus]|uniref:Lipoprotein n=1 Tax=Oceanomicrobium pacificus TaxID=2692916 RepID=A0A6B0TU64_9RHOB|nr:hypothetical protein [Oceanomicrobium pacificus]MXU64503.1 hypothetical protein [Oceanomicrobium pacificus]
MTKTALALSVAAVALAACTEGADPLPTTMAEVQRYCLKQAEKEAEARLGTDVTVALNSKGQFVGTQRIDGMSRATVSSAYYEACYAQQGRIVRSGGGTEVAPGVFLTPAELETYNSLTPAQQQRAQEFIRNGSTLSASLGDK